MDGPAESLIDQLSLIEEQPNYSFRTKYKPVQRGNTATVSYGGFQIGIAVNAAIKTVRTDHRIYSALGQFLGPVSPSHGVTCTVEKTRDTRSFTSRLVRLSQQQADGKQRLCLVALVDFHPSEPSVLHYSPSPSLTYSHWRECPSDETERNKRLVAQGYITKALAERYTVVFGGLRKWVESRQCPESMSAQNLAGAAKGIVTTQDALRPSDRTTAEWLRTVDQSPTDAGAQASVLAFRMDAGLSNLAGAHHNLFVDDFGVSSSLEFALRFFVPEVDLRGWHLCERKAICANMGITHAISNLWDESGQLVASMSQQCIMRPAPSDGPKL